MTSLALGGMTVFIIHTIKKPPKGGLESSKIMCNQMILLPFQTQMVLEHTTRAPRPSVVWGIYLLRNKTTSSCAQLTTLSLTPSYTKSFRRLRTISGSRYAKPSSHICFYVNKFESKLQANFYMYLFPLKLIYNNLIRQNENKTCKISALTL